VSAAAPTIPVKPESTAGEFGMWVFLATEILFFGVLFFGYAVTRIHHPQAFALASRHTDVVLGTINTAVLLSSSLTIALAARSLKAGSARASGRLLVATLILGLTFLSLKLLEYSHDVAEGLVPWSHFTLGGPDASGERLFFLMYFVMTGAHAVHLIAGLTLVGIMRLALARGWISVERFEPVEITGLYWHLVDIVWIFLYPLLYLVSRT
jgi:cytochrome c oxidase subunit III